MERIFRSNSLDRPLASQNSIPTTTVSGNLMPRLSYRRLVRSTGGACLTLLAWALLAPTPVRGACEHPSHAQGDPTSHIGHFNLLSHLGAIPNSPDPGSRPQRTPCSGPSCSQRPALPTGPGAPAIPKIMRGDLWGVPLVDSSIRLPSIHSLALEQCRFRAVDLASDLFRPPRLSPA
jgi:hypothetical protein